jgi:hypothetical protein
MSARKVSTMTEDQLIEVIRHAVRTELDMAGLSINDSADVKEARADFAFVRRFPSSFQRGRVQNRRSDHPCHSLRRGLADRCRRPSVL